MKLILMFCCKPITYYSYLGVQYEHLLAGKGQGKPFVLFKGFLVYMVVCVSKN